MIDDYHEMWRDMKETSKLIRYCRNQDEYADKLTEYEKLAVYIACNVEHIGNRASNGYWLDSRDIRQLMYARTDKEITGSSLISEIERLSANDVLVDKTDEPTIIFFPNETIEKINAPSVSAPTLTEQEIDQNLGIYADD
jgi:hypothetical protein